MLTLGIFLLIGTFIIALFALVKDKQYLSIAVLLLVIYLIAELSSK